MLTCGRLLQGALAVLLTLSSTWVCAAKDALLFLEYAQGDKRIAWAITDKPEPLRPPTKNPSALSWHLRQGTPVTAASMPAPRRVDFYQGEGAQRQLIFALEVRYFPGKDNKSGQRGKWLPHYRLHQELLFVRDEGGQWRPLETLDEVPLAVDYRSPTLPNAQGYYAELDFGLTVGQLRIDVGQVVDATASPFSPPP